jgi:hypothetical protein
MKGWNIFGFPFEVQLKGSLQYEDYHIAKYTKTNLPLSSSANALAFYYP